MVTKIFVYEDYAKDSNVCVCVCIFGLFKISASVHDVRLGALLPGLSLS